jgi:hypothetical protein
VSRIQSPAGGSIFDDFRAVQSEQDGAVGPGDTLAHVEHFQSRVGAFVRVNHDSGYAFRGERIHCGAVHDAARIRDGLARIYVI